jgi:hypothetical protein
VQTAEIAYLLFKGEKKGDGWSGIHYTPHTKKIVESLFPQHTELGSPQEMRIVSLEEVIVPEAMIRPRI